MKNEVEYTKLSLKLKKSEPTETDEKEEKEISPYKRHKALQKAIRLRRNDMKLLIAVAVGEKLFPMMCSHSAKFLERSEADDRRFLWTLRQLRDQIRCLEQEASLLKEIHND